MTEHKCFPPYTDKFKPGDVAIAKEHIPFTDGTKHSSGQEILVTEENKTYFNVQHRFYDKKESK